MNGPPILVGVDGSPASLAAVDLGAREAVLRGRRLRIVCCDAGAGNSAWVDLPMSAGPGISPVDPQQAVGLAAARIDLNLVAMVAEVLSGEPAAILIRESEQAELLVLGHRGRGGFPELLLGSVTTRVAGHAHCPVLVTRAMPIPTAGDVVLGIDGSRANRAAVGLAFAAAARYHTGIIAMHAWSGPNLTGPTDVLIISPGPERAAQASLLAESVDPWTRKYKSVPVRRRVVQDSAAHALVQAGRSAQLIVLGRRGDNALPGRRLGSVSHAVLHHATCPVAVVPAGE
jgi:nucleotide-binding universal stress UspA family protein